MRRFPVFAPFFATLASLMAMVACQSPTLPGNASALAQTPGRTPLQVQIQSSGAVRFPADWQGVWSGRCTNTGPGGKQTYAPVEMRLTIQPQAKSAKGDWQWKIEYHGSEMNQVRDYSLQPVDAAKGQWLIDEHNGIQLDNFLVSGSLLHEAFSVGNTLIVGTHRLIDSRNLKVELVSFLLQAPRNSGSQEFPVSAFKLLSVQDCPMTKS
ncbi:MAG TPA: hypothetical protein V6D23_10560 [Candidatus Obscuribacterales bacterium]